MANLWLVIKALLVILPYLIELVQNGKIKEGAYTEVLAALNGRIDARIQAAVEAGKLEPVDEDTDPANRSR